MTSASLKVSLDVSIFQLISPLYRYILFIFLREKNRNSTVVNAEGKTHTCTQDCRIMGLALATMQQEETMKHVILKDELLLVALTCMFIYVCGIQAIDLT